MKRKKLERGTAIRAYWWDTQTIPKWTNRDDLKNIQPPLCRTTGEYEECHKEKGKIKWIIISHNIHDSDQQCDFTIIPYGCIQRIEKIK